MEQIKKNLILIWKAEDNPRFSVYSDGEQFIAEIVVGYEWDGRLSVGYSSINGAIDADDLCLNDQPAAVKEVGWERSSIRDEPMDIRPIKDAIQRAYDKLKMKDILKMTPALLTLAMAADQAFNELL